MLATFHSASLAQTPLAVSEVEPDGVVIATPREAVIKFITTLTSLPTPENATDTRTDATPAKAALIDSSITDTTPPTDATDEPPLGETGVDEPPLDDTGVDEPDPKLEQPDFRKGIPFYVSAKDYLKKRGSADDTLLRLNYSVSSYNAKTGIPSGARETTLLIASDYAAVKTDDKTRLFDFVFNRYLTIDHNQTPPPFTHTSLFPIVLKKIETVRGATQNGTLSTLKLSPELSLDAVWMESALGYSARKAPPSLDIVINETGVTAQFGATQIFSSTTTATPFPSPQHRSGFFALLHHSLSIHPAILNAYATKSAPDHGWPKHMKIRKVSPQLSDGVDEIWTLKDSETTLAPFPLPETALSITEQPTVSPRAFVIAKAAEGDAIGGFSSRESVKRALEAIKTDNDPFKSWLLTYRLSEIDGECPKAPSCKDLRQQEADYGTDENFMARVEAFKAQKTFKDRIQAIKVLDAYVKATDSEADIPAIALRRLAMIRSRIKPVDAKTYGIDNVNPQNLLETAIAKDPYDPQSYKGLSQIFAARKSYVESWDLQDALRYLPLTRRPIMEPTERAEAAILQQAPAFFSPKP